MRVKPKSKSSVPAREKPAMKIRDLTTKKDVKGGVDGEYKDKNHRN
jgi:hypothetical protein